MATFKAGDKVTIGDEKGIIESVAVVEFYHGSTLHLTVKLDDGCTVSGDYRYFDLAEEATK